MSPETGHMAGGVRGGGNRVLRWLLPSNTYLRFLLATLVLAGATGTMALAISFWMARSTVHELQDEAGFTLLRNAVDLIGRSRIGLEEQHNSYIEDRKYTLRTINGYTREIIAAYRERALAGEMDDEEARRAALAQLNEIVPTLQYTVYVVDGDDRYVVHPSPYHRGISALAHQDARGHPVLGPMLEQARNPDDQTQEFFVYPWTLDQNGRTQYKLALAHYYEPWDMVICSELYMGDMQDTLSDAYLASLNELRARLMEITIAKTGYIYVFDESCLVIAHPTLVDDNLDEFLLPGSDQSLCGTLKRTAEQPWGSNKLAYLWDRPADEGNYVYPKISWCTREPTTGWYVGVSAYRDELEAAIPGFMRGTAIPALLSLLVLGAGLGLLLRKLLKPVHLLAGACERLGSGDLSVRAPENAPGEIGFLCLHFNNMIRSLAELHQAEQERRVELETLNRNLERIVGLRTRALERKARSLEELNMRLRDLDAMKSSFLSSVSHELRTPLTSIRGFAKLIAKEFARSFAPFAGDERGLSRKAKRIKQNLEIIGAEGERLTRLINDVLDLAKIESGQMDWQESNFSLKELLEQCVQSVSGLLDSKPGVRFRLALAGDLGRIIADRDRFTQVFLNLLNNAIKFTDTGIIRLSACRGEDGIQIRIRDTGSGIERRDLMSIFDKFHQSGGRDTLQDKPRGTGLGLAICHNVISRYGGLIWAESELGSGAELVVELPPSIDLGEALREMPEPAVPAPSHDPLKEPLILVAGHRPEMRIRLAGMFKLHGMRVALAPDGAEALDTARRLRPDLLVLDAELPDMDCWHMLRDVNSLPELGGLPMMVLAPPPDAADSDASWPGLDSERLPQMARDLILPHASGSWECLLLDPEGKGTPRDMADICRHVELCRSAEHLSQRLHEGFTGAVFLTAKAGVLDLASLARHPSLLVVILPDTAEN